ncbi:Uncharacterized protein CK203_000716 [Vitis vinifera]|uniref:Uncharacterized protein n=1 Tax=Vitis vinifera TaxID=29760 RepID=A0A438KQH2_VITVI|nr:Uncharacterized protein CK203_000716 [Vitis vinifera]
MSNLSNLPIDVMISYCTLSARSSLVNRKLKLQELSKFGRPAKMRSSSWWIRYFVQTSLEENEAAIKKFDQLQPRSLTSQHARCFTSTHTID